MHEKISFILNRRSIRKYQQKSVESEKVRDLLRAAMAAPSAGNRQPWHFVVVTERETLDRLAEDHPYGKMLHQAPLCIAVCGEPEASSGGAYWVQDCSAAMQNLLLAADSLGLGAVWLGVYSSEKREQTVSNALQLPEHIRPLGLASIGYPAEQKPPSDRYDESKVHHESFSCS